MQYFLLLSLFVLSASACNQNDDNVPLNPPPMTVDTTEVTPDPEPDSLVLIWSDEFDGNSLDTDSWNVRTGDGCPNLCGWGNNEKQIYTDTSHRIANGMLTITITKEGQSYRSTRINTQGKREYRYGRIETRAKLPIGEGIWPAFWMLGGNIDRVGWPACGEIDILEYVGKLPGQVFTSLHHPANHAGNAISKITPAPDIEEGFHTYAVEWDAERISFYLDGERVFVYAPDSKGPDNWPYNQPFYIILNVAVGGNFGGPAIDDSIFPQAYVIDYVRVYEYQ